MWKTHNADARAVAMFRFADHPYQAVFLTPPEVEESAAAAFAALGRCVGLTDPDRFEPSAEAFGYAAYKAWLILLLARPPKLPARGRSTWRPGDTIAA